VVVVLLAGCDFFASGPSWQDQLEPAGPCYAFNFADGVDVASNNELHAIFACLNSQGMLNAFVPADAALDVATRSGSVGSGLVGLLDAAGKTRSVSAGGLLAGALKLFDDREGSEELLELILEVAYGAAVTDLGNGVTVNSSVSLHDGLLLPVVESMAAAATLLLDDDLALGDSLGAALRSEEAPRWVWSLALAPVAPDAGLAALAADWPLVLAEIIEETEDASNNRHSGGTGNSLRDAASALFDGNALPDIVSAAGPLLGDEHTRDALARWVEEEDDAGRWEDLDDGLLYLARVDRDGGSLSDGEDSALVSLVRLLHDANQPVDCRIDLFVTDIHWSLGNLAVAILEVLAGIDADTAAGGVDILGNALGYPLTDAILETIADSGVCPVIDAQLVADLESLDRLSDPPAEDLLLSLLGLLQASDDHIEAVADLATSLHAAGLVEPLEELLFDLATRFPADRLLLAVPSLLDPDGRQASSAFPAGIRPVDVHVLATLLLAVTDSEHWEVVEPVLGSVIRNANTWEAVGNAPRLLTRADTVTGRLLPLLAERIAAEPELPWLPAAADYVEDPGVFSSALVLLEVQPLRAALLDTALLAPGPVPWLASLYVGGTVDKLWDTFALFRPLLGDPDV
jgi:hypothetical protein